MTNAIIYEAGNGFPRKGDHVVCNGDLSRVTDDGAVVHTDTSGRGRANHIFAEIVPADWDDCDEEDVFPATVELWEQD